VAGWWTTHGDQRSPKKKTKKKIFESLHPNPRRLLGESRSSLLCMRTCSKVKVKTEGEASPVRTAFASRTYCTVPSRYWNLEFRAWPWSSGRGNSLFGHLYSIHADDNATRGTILYGTVASVVLVAVLPPYRLSCHWSG